jgi:hypothetical protein
MRRNKTGKKIFWPKFPLANLTACAPPHASLFHALIPCAPGLIRRRNDLSPAENDPIPPPDEIIPRPDALR